MEAICKPDFDRRVKANKDALEAQKARKNVKAKDAKIIKVPAIGFHEVYGVWFYGKLKAIIIQVGMDRFETNLNKTMHVFVDVEPKNISDGVHDITVYGHHCRLYKWMGQGYHRGLVVFDDDEVGNRSAEIYRQSGTWSWILRQEEIR